MPPNYDATTAANSGNGDAQSLLSAGNKSTPLTMAPHSNGPIGAGTRPVAVPQTTGGAPASSPANTQFKIDPNLIQAQVIKVAIRLKPLNTVSSDTNESAKVGDGNASSSKKSKPSEKKAWTLQKSGATDSFIQNGVVRKVEGRSVFHFDQIFDEDTKTPLLYKSLARPMVKNVISGRHGTIFAYGSTGTGKTFTMQGDGKAASGQAGIIQLVASDLFRFMRQGAAMSRDFTVKVSYIEIYNEKIRDLLCETNPSKNNTNHNSMMTASSSAPEITIRTTANGDIAVNSTQKEVENVDNVLELLISGNKYRMVAETDRNLHSSRSHAIFRLSVESRSKGMASVVTAPDAAGELVRISDFNLVDLAGSESLKHSGSNTVRQREGININQSLMSLSGVIHSLSTPAKKRPKFISYRDSKLTRILQPHLSGNADMAIICCASAGKSSLEETRSTLRFAHRAKLVEMKPKINEIVDDGALIKKLQAELEAAKRALEEMKEQQENVQFNAPSTPSAQHQSLSYEPAAMSGGSEHSHPQEEEFATPARRYIMPKDHQLSTSSTHSAQDHGPSRMGGGGGGGGGPSRAYVMPKDQAIPEASSFQKFVSTPSTMGMSTSMDSNFTPNAASPFQLDNVPDSASANGSVFRPMNGGHSPDVNMSSNLLSKPFHGSHDEDISAIADVSSSFEGGTITPPKKTLNALDFPIPQRMDRTGTTAEMEDDSFGGRSGSHPDNAGPEASYAEVSIKYGHSVVSAPESIAGPGERSRTGRTTESGNFALSEPNGTNTISWDTVKLDAPTKAHVGTPLQVLRNLENNDAPIPVEVTIIKDDAPIHKGNACLTDQLADAEMRSDFLERKVEAADDLVEALFKDLERARLCIHDLVHRNVTLATKVKEAKREGTKEAYQAGEVVLEQYWLLKGSMYASLFFFFTGGYELFTATVIMIWLIMESTIVKPHPDTTVQEELE